MLAAILPLTLPHLPGSLGEGWGLDQATSAVGGEGEALLVALDRLLDRGLGALALGAVQAFELIAAEPRAVGVVNRASRVGEQRAILVAEAAKVGGVPALAGRPLVVVGAGDQGFGAAVTGAVGVDA